MPGTIVGQRKFAIVASKFAGEAAAASTSLQPITAAESGVDCADRYRRCLPEGTPHDDRNMQQNPVPVLRIVAARGSRSLFDFEQRPAQGSGKTIAAVNSILRCLSYRATLRQKMSDARAILHAALRRQAQTDNRASSMRWLLVESPFSLSPNILSAHDPCAGLFRVCCKGHAGSRALSHAVGEIGIHGL
jgi:hypothetical protein